MILPRTANAVVAVPMLLTPRLCLGVMPPASWDHPSATSVRPPRPRLPFLRTCRDGAWSGTMVPTRRLRRAPGTKSGSKASPASQVWQEDATHDNSLHRPRSRESRGRASRRMPSPVRRRCSLVAMRARRLLPLRRRPPSAGILAGRPHQVTLSRYQTSTHQVRRSLRPHGSVYGGRCRDHPPHGAPSHALGTGIAYPPHRICDAALADHFVGKVRRSQRNLSRVAGRTQEGEDRRRLDNR